MLSSFSSMAGRKETIRCDGDLFDILFEFDTIFSPAQHTLQATTTTIFFSGRRGISRFLSFSFPFGRSVDKTTTTTTTHPSGGVRRGPLRSIASSSSSSSRARERERKSTNHPFGICINESLSLFLSRRPKDVCSKKSTFFVGKTDRPFRLFLPSRLNCQNSLTTNERKQTNKKKKTDD